MLSRSYLPYISPNLRYISPYISHREEHAQPVGLQQRRALGVGVRG